MHAAQVGDSLSEFLVEATADPKLRQLMTSMSEAIRTIAYKVRRLQLLGVQQLQQPASQHNCGASMSMSSRSVLHGIARLITPAARLVLQVRTASCGGTACVNSFGDEQLAVDMVADNLLFEALKFSVSTAQGWWVAVSLPCVQYH